MHGDKDGLVPLVHSEVLEAALKKAGVEVTLRVIPGAGHGFGGMEINQEVSRFFDRHLAGASIYWRCETPCLLPIS
jgi:dipeptidyl aminopeptidase/acylaminoacyl peptidase